MITQPTDLYKKLAEKYNLSVQDIRQLIFFVYRTGLLEGLTNFIKPEIYMRGLGSFKVKGERQLSKYIKGLEECFKDGQFICSEAQLYKIKLLEDLTRVSKDFHQIFNDKEDFDNSRNISKQSQNLGGTTQQTVQE